MTSTILAKMQQWTITQAPNEFCPYVGLQPTMKPDQDYFFGLARQSYFLNLYAAPSPFSMGRVVGKTPLRAGCFRACEPLVHCRAIFESWSIKTFSLR
jgi:hypothetical protein